jgi:hypothetical protein
MSNNRSGISKFGDSEHSFILSKKRPASIPPFISKANVTTRFHLFWAISYWMRFQEGYFTIHIWMLF